MSIAFGGLCCMSDFPRFPVRLRVFVTPDQYRELEHARYIWFNRHGAGMKVPSMGDFVSLLLTRLTEEFIYEMCENKNMKSEVCEHEN